MHVAYKQRRERLTVLPLELLNKLSTVAVNVERRFHLIAPVKPSGETDEYDSELSHEVRTSYAKLHTERVTRESADNEERNTEQETLKAGDTVILIVNLYGERLRLTVAHCIGFIVPIES